jgi:hypothetical protein
MLNHYRLVKFYLAWQRTDMVRALLLRRFCDSGQFVNMNFIGVAGPLFNDINCKNMSLIVSVANRYIPLPERS